MDKDEIKKTVIDAMSDFYNTMLSNRFDNVDKNIDGLHNEITDLRLTNEALVKVVEYSKLQARVTDLENRLNKLES